MAAEYFCSLYRQRVGHICKFPGRKRWQTWKGKLEDFQIMAVIADGGRGGISRGCHWSEETRFAVLDIDAGSQYHTQEKLAELSAAVENVGLKINLYQSSGSGGWHLYIPLAGWQKSSEVEHTFKRWLKSLGYEIRGGQLEVFPSGNGLRLPLQPGFAWLAHDGSLIRRREDITLNEALAYFLEDLEANAQSWQFAKSLMDSQISAADRAAGGDAQAYQKRLEMSGFDDFFNCTMIPEHCEKARQYLASGLTKEGTRHEALFTIQHLLWHGDRWLGVPRLPGRKNAARRFNFLRQWIEQNHNGQCSHINRGDWRTIEAHIFRLVNWQRSDLPRLSDYEPYRATERAEERLFELFMATGRIFSMDDLRKANEDREQEARQKIAEAVRALGSSGQKVTGRKLSQLSGCSRNTIRKHHDLWLQGGSGVKIRGGARGLAVVSCSEVEEKKESPAFEIESSSGAGCVLDSLRYDRTGQTARNSRQVSTEVLAAVHPIQSNYGVKHELQGSAPRSLVAAGGMDCGINGASPEGTPPFNPRPIFSIGAPAQNLRQVGNRCDGLMQSTQADSSLAVWISSSVRALQLDKAKAQYWWCSLAVGHPPLSCYDKRRQRAGGRLLCSDGYMVLGAEARAMGNESHEKPEHQQDRPAERKGESLTPARGEITNAAQDYTEQVKAQRTEQKVSGSSKATGAGADAYGKGGLASAKDLLGDDAHGLSKKEKQAALLAQIERDGYIVGVGQPKEQKEQAILISQAIPEPQLNSTSVPDANAKVDQELGQISQGYGIDYSLERARQKAQEESHKQFDGKDAKNNDEFLDMFLNGSGNDKQLHTKRGDPVLEDFINSPGVQAMRDQYLKLGCPSETTKLSYGTKEAFVDTVAKPFGDSATHLFTDLFDEKHLGSVGTQVGGFGNPPKEYPWATANATRCNAEGKPDGKGEFVQYHVTNVAGAHSWGAHAVPDRPLGSTGPYRSIIQVFSWTEPIPHKANEKK